MIRRFISKTTRKSGSRNDWFGNPVADLGKCPTFLQHNLEVSEKVLIFADRNKTCKI